MNLQYKIEPITAENYEKCSNLWDMEKQPQTNEWLEEIRSGVRLPFAYVVDGVFLGECALVLAKDDPHYTIPGKRAYLSRLIVKDSCRRQGIGRILTDCVIEEAKRRGFSELSLGVDKDNTAARHLYAVKGFDTVLFEGEDKYGAFYKLLKKL